MILVRHPAGTPVPMTTPRSRPATRLLATAAALLLGLAPARAADYLFSYFTGNGEDGLHLARSTDGYTWETLNGGRSFLLSLIHI